MGQDPALGRRPPVPPATVAPRTIESACDRRRPNCGGRGHECARYGMRSRGGMARLKHVQRSQEKWMPSQLDDSRAAVGVAAADMQAGGFQTRLIVRVEPIVAEE